MIGEVKMIHQLVLTFIFAKEFGLSSRSDGERGEEECACEPHVV